MQAKPCVKHQAITQSRFPINPVPGNWLVPPTTGTYVIHTGVARCSDRLPMRTASSLATRQTAVVFVMSRYLSGFSQLLSSPLWRMSTYVLFVPSRSFNHAIDWPWLTRPVNSFVLLDAETQMKLMPFTAASHLVGICKFDTVKCCATFAWQPNA